jgi:DNA-binding XRE family transcriptional regulator
MKFATQWRKWRVRNLLSQAAMARALGIALKTVNNIEAGRTEPNYINQARFKALVERYRRSKVGK